jgi:2-keto-4-pentenoate hydratase
VVGWKIAATSPAGQTHIGVDGPLGGPLLANRVLADGAAVPLDGNIMMVAEAEFAFTFARALPRREDPYTQDEVLGAVESLHPAIEVPDSRYNDFAAVGAPQLIADTACADYFVLGAPTAADWRSRDLASHVVAAFRNGEKVATGSGANVLGDPRIALAWLVNELRTCGDGILAGQFVTTGTCVKPVPIQRGDTVRVDFGEFGTTNVVLI